MNLDKSDLEHIQKLLESDTTECSIWSELPDDTIFKAVLKNRVAKTSVVLDKIDCMIEEST